MQANEMYRVYRVHKMASSISTITCSDVVSIKQQKSIHLIGKHNVDSIKESSFPSVYQLLLIQFHFQILGVQLFCVNEPSYWRSCRLFYESSAALHMVTFCRNYAQRQVMTQETAYETKNHNMYSEVVLVTVASVHDIPKNLNHELTRLLLELVTTALINDAHKT